MKVITEKTQIAKALNFGKYPVLYLDLAKDKIEGYENCYRGQRTKTEWNYEGEKYYHFGQLAYYNDSKTLKIIAENSFLTKGISFTDIQAMVLNANATEVKPEQEVIVVIMNSEKYTTSYPILTKTSKYNDFCITAMTIEGDFSEIINQLK